MNTATHKQAGQELAVNLTDREFKNFIRKVNRDGPIPDQENPHYKGLKACWEWTGCKSKDGYGRFFLNGKATASHRISWSLRNGHLPAEVYVLHKCDNPPCVNPDHLILGTQHENMVDCSRKLRFGNKEGLNRQDVLKIRQLHSEGQSYKDLASEFKVNYSKVSKIIRRRLLNWID